MACETSNIPCPIDIFIIKDLPIWLTAIASCLLAYFAWKALSSWQNQIRAKKQIEFLEEISNAIHGYANGLFFSFRILDDMNEEIDSYQHDASLTPSSAKNGLICYRKEHGREKGKCLLYSLEDCVEHSQKLQDLNSKGEFLGLKSYNLCKEFYEYFEQQYISLRIIGTYFNAPDLNNNGNISIDQDLQSELLNINSKEDRAKLKTKMDKEFSSFLEDNYRSLYSTKKQ